MPALFPPYMQVVLYGSFQAFNKAMLLYNKELV